MIYLSEATTCAFVQGFLAIRADDGAEIVLDEDEVQKLREALLQRQRAETRDRARNAIGSVLETVCDNWPYCSDGCPDCAQKALDARKECGASG